MNGCIIEPGWDDTRRFLGSGRANVREPWDDGLLWFRFRYACREGDDNDEHLYCCYTSATLEASSHAGMADVLQRRQDDANYDADQTYRIDIMRHGHANARYEPAHTLYICSYQWTTPLGDDGQLWLTGRWQHPPVGPRLSETSTGPYPTEEAT